MKAIHIFIALLYVAFASSTFAQLTNRPKVGLVLGGGGALGFAHIGVLRVLEEQRIPIDYIAGTSMGSIIAGLYACGLSPDDMEAFLKGLDWNEVMNDETPRRELFFRQKQDDQRYLFDMGLNWNGPKFNTGMAVGQKFNNLMQLITLRSASVTNFDLLPIPYRAVATDLASGKAFVIRHGNLATAMRASMAVPGVFTPIELDGHLLVDGGVVNNLPVDVVKAMGADIVIAVDVGSDSDTVDPSQLRSLGGILGRTYAIAQRPNSLEQLGKADIKLQPVLAGFTASQFDRVADLIPPGERAARAHLAELAGLGVGEADYAAFLQRQRRGVPPSPRVSEVAVTGCDRVSEAIVRGRIRSEPGALFDPQTMQRDLMRMYGIGEFEQVMFRLEPGADGGGRLAYEVREKNWGPLYLAYGVNLRSDFEYDADWRMLVNVTRRSINALGAEWRNEAELGSGQAVLSEFYQPLDHRGILFVAPTVEYRAEREALYQDGDHVADYNVRQMEMRLDPGVQLRHYAELRAGPVWGTGKADVETGSAELPNVDEDYAGWNIRLTVDRQDRTLFAREGYFVELEGMLAREGLGSDQEYDKVSGTLTKQSSVGDHTITATVLGGSALGSDLPGYNQFTLGGPFSFAGLAEDQFRGSYLGVASLGYRYRLNQLPAQLGRAVYVLTRFDTGNVWDDDADLDDLRYGGALGIGADTAFGPLYLAYGRADQGYSRVYFSLGTAF
jgi:NTE family protein